MDKRPTIIFDIVKCLEPEECLLCIKACPRKCIGYTQAEIPPPGRAPVKWKLVSAFMHVQPLRGNLPERRDTGHGAGVAALDIPTGDTPNQQSFDNASARMERVERRETPRATPISMKL
jgi:ferredoxin